jgi:hypothetical protein
MALSGETPNVILEGFTLLLPATLQILRIARPHVCAIKVADEDLLDILPGVDRVSGHVIKPGPIHVDQLNGEELVDEEVIIPPTSLACEAIVLQEDAEIFLPSLSTMLFGAQKHLGKHALHMLHPNTLGPSPLGLRLHLSRSSCLSRCRLRP